MQLDAKAFDPRYAEAAEELRRRSAENLQRLDGDNKRLREKPLQLEHELSALAELEPFVAREIVSGAANQLNAGFGAMARISGRLTRTAVI